jgi:TonB family protein
MTVYLAPKTQLPWSSSQDDDSRFNIGLGIGLAILLVLVIIVSRINVPEIPREEKERIPPQLARVMLEKQELPPPKPVEPPKEELPPEPKPEEPKPEEPKPEPKPIELAPPPRTVEEAREKAEQSGLMQHKDELMAMRELLDTSSLENQSLSEGGTQAANTERAMPNSGRTSTSGGVNLGELSTNTGTGNLAGRDTTQVTSDLANATQAAAGPGAGSGESGRSRSEEEMSRVMDQHKGAIFQIYNRALRQNATLQGRVVMNIVIEPSGQISDVSIVTSELRDPELEAALIRRVRMISFPANSGVIRTTLRQTFDFLPQ